MTLTVTVNYFVASALQTINVPLKKHTYSEQVLEYNSTLTYEVLLLQGIMT